ncbi:uncharacterized protein LOC141821478 [Curcuma longa]|uniref:uncharacterized protein LOC141821478 n=1 Tax=Curcuma longa TaxID=136217 RepID=UPI003D9E261F
MRAVSRIARTKNQIQEFLPPSVRARREVMACRRRNSVPRSSTSEGFRPFPEESPAPAASSSRAVVQSGLARQRHSLGNDTIRETRKLQVKGKPVTRDAKPGTRDASSRSTKTKVPTNLSHNPAGREVQLKASRDVANATTAKSKILLLELKTAKEELAFAKERCAQLEEENKTLRESRQKGDTPADDDLIRLQLETLLAEKSRLANENDIIARENMFLREMVEYHQLTEQGILYLDDSNEGKDDSEAYLVDEFLTFSSSHPDSEVPSHVLSSPRTNLAPGSSSPSASLGTISHTILGPSSAFDG